ncbi:Hypothetical protein PP7435_CHR2-1341 [Komagataella phaffii CBS 7435]|uniref:Uncharacterized protein n=1 Tax=Komagataella phaffii (strain ATCC 76273 / CBS 7435 / CECT 11047 / NRRL Y-11430 / Wegner 21-1) TaxID=981350 RepID=A0A1G4KPM0_KOMPC|nr:Hypothetical protein BQ9382_C2-0242 [Komagataella phaffii CBS 7435]SCV11961.1 Hypothetical protein PP7435_CHR2-1341 [Komagataella phaffii CBS 7435]
MPMVITGKIQTFKTKSSKIRSDDARYHHFSGRLSTVEMTMNKLFSSFSYHRV